MPDPPAKDFSSPVVPPEAAAANTSSPMSMFQAPLPTGMPASVASYCASSLPCAATGSAPHATTSPQRAAKASRPAERGLAEP